MKTRPRPSEEDHSLPQGRLGKSQETGIEDLGCVAASLSPRPAWAQVPRHVPASPWWGPHPGRRSLPKKR